MPSTHTLSRTLAVLAALAIPASASAEEVVEVRIFENSKTTDETVLFLAGVEKGDEINTAEEIPKIKERLVSSGLFKEVEVYSTPQGGGVRLNIEAKDKHSWAVAPTYYNQPTNKGFGFGFGENNLFGENKKLLLYGQVACLFLLGRRKEGLYLFGDALRSNYSQHQWLFDRMPELKTDQDVQLVFSTFLYEGGRQASSSN